MDFYFDLYFLNDDIPKSARANPPLIEAEKSAGNALVAHIQFAEAGSGTVRIFVDVKDGASRDLTSITLKAGFTAGGGEIKQDQKITFENPITQETPGGTLFLPDGRLDERAWALEDDKDGISCFSMFFLQYHFEDGKPVLYQFGAVFMGALPFPGSYNETLPSRSTEFRGKKDGVDTVAHAGFDGFDRHASGIVRLYVPVADIDEIYSVTIKAGMDVRGTGKEVKNDITFRVKGGGYISADTVVSDGQAVNITGNTEDWLPLEYMYVSDYTQVIFYGIDRHVIKMQSVLKGGEATAPQAPEVEGYTFRGWSENLTNIQGVTHVYAKYTSNTSAKAGGCGSAGAAFLLLSPIALFVKRRA
jgi:hypothetical protein